MLDWFELNAAGTILHHLTNNLDIFDTESASAKPELVRKKVARRKRDERRSTQHVSADDIKQADSDAVPTVEVTVTQPVANDTRKEVLHNYFWQCASCCDNNSLQLGKAVKRLFNHNSFKTTTIQLKDHNMSDTLILGPSSKGAWIREEKVWRERCNVAQTPGRSA